MDRRRRRTPGVRLPHSQVQEAQVAGSLERCETGPPRPARLVVLSNGSGSTYPDTGGLGGLSVRQSVRELGWLSKPWAREPVGLLGTGLGPVSRPCVGPSHPPVRLKRKLRAAPPNSSGVSHCPSSSSSSSSQPETSLGDREAFHTSGTASPSHPCTKQAYPAPHQPHRHKRPQGHTSRYSKSCGLDLAAMHRRIALCTSAASVHVTSKAAN